MVGNDFVIPAQKQLVPKRQIVIRREPIDIAQAQDTSSRINQNLGTLAFNAMNAQLEDTEAYFVPTSREFHLNFLTRTRVTVMIVSIVLVSMAAVAIANKQTIVSYAHDVSTVISEMRHNNTATSAAKVNPRQLIMHSSDYDTAMTDLMTQQITLNVDGTSQVVSPATVTSWITTKNVGSLVYLSVNANALSSSLKQAAGGSYSSAAFNQIANNLLKAQGMSVTLTNS